MAWIQINITVNENLAEPISDAFMEANAASVTFMDAQDQPIFEPDLGTTPVWQNTKVIALFDAEVDPQPIIDFVCQQLTNIEFKQFKVEQLEDKDWVRAWMDHFKPMQFGETLWIVPTHCETPDPQANNLYLDPGLAFGTGTHPTTSLCLTWLDKHPPKALSVIDYGCGSGILALAAQKLGAKQVSGTDIDPQAITASEQNAERNHEKIDFALVKDYQAEPADLLVANILAGPLKELSAEFDRLLKPQGQLVISGLLTTQAPDLVNFYQNLGFHLLEQNDLDDWSQLCFQKA